MLLTFNAGHQAKSRIPRIAVHGSLRKAWRPAHRRYCCSVNAVESGQRNDRWQTSASCQERLSPIRAAAVTVDRRHTVEMRIKDSIRRGMRITVEEPHNNFGMRLMGETWERHSRSLSDATKRMSLALVLAAPFRRLAA